MFNLIKSMTKLKDITFSVCKAKILGIQTTKMSSQSITKREASRVVWVDLEMTGLNIETDRILEIACLVSDADLNVIAKGPNIVIHQPDEILNNMSEWCIAHHGESGLTKASRESKISLSEAENEVLDFMKSHVPEKRCPLGGNSVYMDRLFIRKYMPRVDDYLHYRIIDVSSFKEMVKRWFPKEYSNIPKKKFAHRSMDDICDSLAELKYYRENVFIKQSSQINNHVEK